MQKELQVLLTVVDPETHLTIVDQDSVPVEAIAKYAGDISAFSAELYPQISWAVASLFEQKAIEKNDRITVLFRFVKEKVFVRSVCYKTCSQCGANAPSSPCVYCGHS